MANIFPSSSPSRSTVHRYRYSDIYGHPSCYSISAVGSYCLAVALDFVFLSLADTIGFSRPTRHLVRTPPLGHQPPPMSSHLGQSSLNTFVVLTKFSILKLTSSELALFWLKAYVDYARALRPQARYRLSVSAYALRSGDSQTHNILDIRCLSGIVETSSVHSLLGFDGFELEGRDRRVLGSRLTFDATFVDAVIVAHAASQNNPR
ncbi:hypothetical protein C8R47DRAFT_1324651 [Mycena vitilis]|nr:hypothetical protein C8R47DRAFT_1324651 [Mycena vitilis]